MLLDGVLYLQSLQEETNAAGHCRSGGVYVSYAPYTRTEGSGGTFSVHPHLMLVLFTSDAKSGDGSAVITLASL